MFSSKKEAQRAGEKYYFTGKPCKNGHVANRFSSCNSCVECRKILSKIWYSDRERARKKTAAWRSNNKERSLKSEREWREKNKERVTATQKRWRDKNPERSKKKYRDWYARNIESERLRSLSWNKENKDYCAANARNYRARKKHNGGVHSREDIAAIFQLQSSKCAYCRTALSDDYHVDHVMPLVLGGSNDRANLQITCPTCNQMKHAKHPIEFARQLGLLI